MKVTISKRWRVLFAATLLYLALLSLVGSEIQSASGQTTTGMITGAVADSAGALLPDAIITVINPRTGARRTVATDKQGRYRIRELQVGTYDVRADVVGFRSEIRKGINLTIGREAIVNFALVIGSISEAVIVHSDASLVESTSSAVRGYVSDNQIHILPLNSRSYQQLINLQVGVTALGPAYHGGDAGTGRGDRISVNGARPTSNNYRLDGLDVKDATGQSPVSAARNMLGIDTIQEFEVLSSSYNAEFGGGGAVINIVTQSGTNQFHGQLFEFFRNSALDARNFFDRPDVPIPPFNRHQFGGTAGGPIRSNNLFVFGGYEGLRERLGLSNVGFVPDASARLGLLPDTAHPGQFINVGVNPSVKKYLDLFPLPNGRNFGDGRAEYLSSPNQTTVEDYLMLRADYRPTKSTSAFARYTLYASNVATPDQLGLTRRTEDSFQQYVTLGYTVAISPRTLNVMRVGYNRSKQDSLFVPLFPNADSYNFLPGPNRTFGTAGGIEFGFTSPQLVTGAPITRLGAPLNVPKSHLQNLYHFEDQLSYNRGSHLIKIGFEGKRYEIRSDTPAAQSGTYLFSGSIRDFLGNRPTLFMGLLPGSTSLRYLHQNLFGSYIQDEFRVRPNLTLNIGLRHEFVTLIREKFGIESNLRHPSDQATTLGPIFRNPSLKNFEPRAGFAWQPLQQSTATIRAGFGVFHEQLQYDQTYTIFNRQPPFFVRANLNSPPFPDPFSLGGLNRPITPGIQSVDFDARNPTLLAYNLTLQKELVGAILFTASYVGSHGYHLTRTYEANIAYPQILPDGTKFFPAGRSRRNPNFGSDWRMSFNAKSFYNALQLSARRQSSRGLLFQVSYSFSKNIDDNTGRWDVYSGQSFTIQDPDDFNSDRAPSPIDINQVLTFNYSYELPFGNPRSSFTKAMLAGWQISGITSISSGPPFTVRLGFNNSRNLNNFQLADRPNLLPGFNSNNVISGGPDRYFNPNAFQLPAAGHYGTLGRNTLRAPGIINFDLAMIKNLRFNDKLRLQFRTEVFNLFNHPNFALPVAVIYNDTSGVPSANAGRIFQTSTPSRQVQFAVRLSY